jgi:hypothetical protein
MYNFRPFKTSTTALATTYIGGYPAWVSVFKCNGVTRADWNVVDVANEQNKKADKIMTVLATGEV